MELDETLWENYQLGIIKTLPESFINFEQQKADYYNQTGYGYTGRNYNNIAYSAQLDINANADEATYQELINTDLDFVEQLNALIRARNSAANIVKGHYMFNAYHGLTDHSKIQPMKQEANKTVVDLLHSSFDADAVWSIEIKSKTDPDAKPVGLHKADLVLVHILGTGNTMVYLPSILERKARTDDCYEKIGEIINKGVWHNVKVAKEPLGETDIYAIKLWEYQ